jgi:hypothetical protein
MKNPLPYAKWRNFEALLSNIVTRNGVILKRFYQTNQIIEAIDEVKLRSTEVKLWFWRG